MGNGRLYKDVPESMYEPVGRSRRAIIGTVILAGALFWVFFLFRQKEAQIWILWALLAVILLPALWLTPLRVGYTDRKLYVKRLFRSTVIPFDRIKSVRVFVPSPADGQIFGINGFLGRLGWYKSWEIGLYFAYIGNTDECMLIELLPDERSKERKYVVSCRNYRQMAEALNELLNDR